MHTSTHICDIYDTTKSTWNQANATRTIVSRHCAAAINIDNDVVLCGGYHNESKPLATAERWDHTNQRWSPISSMHGGRAWHAAVFVPKIGVIVTGGVASNSVILDTVEILDPTTNEWRVMEGWKLPIPTHRHSMLFFNYHLYIFDGKGIWLMNPYHHLLFRGACTTSIWQRLGTPQSPWHPQCATGVSLNGEKDYIPLPLEGLSSDKINNNNNNHNHNVQTDPVIPVHIVA
jgi:hypothetical protein